MTTPAITAMGATAVAASWVTLQAALHARRPVGLTYHGRHRIVCPHALGWKNHRPMLLAYQTSGSTTTNEPATETQPQWRCMYIDEIDRIDTADPASPWQTAATYNPDRPFPNIDHVTIAIAPNSPPHAT